MLIGDRNADFSGHGYTSTPKVGKNPTTRKENFI
jgi:hypothetical protein